MDKVAKLKSIAKGLAIGGTGGILGASAGISAEKQIASNKRNARAKRGWDTRRRNSSMNKQAESSDAVSQEMKHAIRTVGTNLNNPKHVVSNYAQRKLITKIRKILGRGSSAK